MSHDAAFEAVVDRVTELLGREIGLRPDSSLRGRLRRCIRDEATAHGENVDAYLQTLLSRPGAVQSLVNRVTVQESGFFRHPEHFMVLARDILPRLTPPITLWSAGCGNGQEAFSLAILLQELGLAGSVIATDLSTAALRRTSAAYYTTRELPGLSADRLAHNLSRDNTGWRINTGPRNRVTVFQHNLVDPIPDEVRRCQVVFCRNVLIYFAPEHARSFLSRLADALPAAEVFLGAAETIWSVSDRYDTIAVDDTFHYRPRAAALVSHPVHPVIPVVPPHPSSAVARRPAPLSPARIPADRIPADRIPTDRIPAARITPARAGVAADTMEAAALGRAGEQALDAGDHETAVIAFRKWAYLTPDDALAHLHLGLALEAAGDVPSARRAFGTSRRAVLAGASAPIPDALGGYATSELLKLLDHKRQALGP